jgi:protease-4
MSGSQAVVDVTLTRVPDLVEREQQLHRIRRMGNDPNVAAILLRIEAPPGGYAACQDLRGVIKATRAAGTQVYAWLDAPGNATMWIASACDRVFVVPTTEIALVGVGTELTFFGAALARLGLEPDFEAAGAYKSFGEPFTRSFASPANQEALQQLVDDLHGQLIGDIAAERGRSQQEMDAIISRAPVFAEDAMASGLVDQLAYGDEVEDWIASHHGEASTLIPFSTWRLRDRVLERLDRFGDGGSIVSVVHMEGPIVMDDNGPSTNIRARKIVPLLADLRKNDNVGAVVLHINSGGGSALASDLMWREVEQIQQVKPVVAIFEDVSASGGYYLAAPAAEIMARPGTLTGSIGVFGGKILAGEGMRKVGVHTQEISAAPNANLYSPSKPFSDAQRGRFKASLQRVYDDFVAKVASGRKREQEDIEPHCRGRVWTGDAARERGLVDRHGDLQDAVERARVLSGLHIGEYVRQDIDTRASTVFSRWMGQALKQARPMGAMAHVAIQATDRILGSRVLDALDLISTHQSEVLALMPFDLDLR